MTFRASIEWQQHTLDPAFYVAAIRRGVRFIFGVEVRKDGSLIEDTQQPGIFAQWQAKERAHRPGQRRDRKAGGAEPPRPITSGLPPAIGTSGAAPSAAPASRIALIVVPGGGWVRELTPYVPGTSPVIACLDGRHLRRRKPKPALGVDYLPAARNALGAPRRRAICD